MASTSPPPSRGDLPFAKDLFEAADHLRGRVESAEYKHLVLGLLFLRYVSDNFERHHLALEQQTRDPDHELSTEDETERADILEDRSEYQASGVFWVPEDARFAKLLAAAKRAGNGPRIDAALELIERENPELRTVLPRYYARSELPNEEMGELVTLIGNVDLGHDANTARDLLGRTYEYFIKAFA
jgi:type I restriction enzyme M protein